MACCGGFLAPESYVQVPAGLEGFWLEMQEPFLSIRALVIADSFRLNSRSSHDGLRSVRVYFYKSDLRGCSPSRLLALMVARDKCERFLEKWWKQR